MSEDVEEKALDWLKRHLGQTVWWGQSDRRYEPVFSRRGQLEKRADGLYGIAPRADHPGFSIDLKDCAIRVSGWKLRLEWKDAVLELEEAETPARRSG